MNTASVGIDKLIHGHPQSISVPISRPIGRSHIIALLVGSVFLFLFARSLIWGQEVSLEDLPLVVGGALPFAFYVAVNKVATKLNSTSLPTNAPVFLAWAWTCSLAAFVSAHILRLFDPIERPIRDVFEAGFLRYESYALVYTVIGFAVSLAIALGISRQIKGTAWAVTITSGFAFNVLYFGVALFMVHF